MRVLVCGWFSFEEMGATAGDLRARDVLCGWLTDAELAFDVAVAPPFAPGVDWRLVDPARYTHLVFVCGPFGNGWPVTELLARFPGARLVGVDLTMLDRIEDWNPFELLLERDSSRTARPDLAFLSEAPGVPVVGVVRAHPQREYRDRAEHRRADALIDAVLRRRDVATVDIDTRLDVNATGLSSAAQVETLISRMDVVVTTRLHGLVLALKSGVPAVAIDPVRGGAKVMRQAAVLGWPHALPVDAADDRTVAAALDECLRPGAAAQASVVARRARERLAPLRAQLVAGIAGRS